MVNQKIGLQYFSLDTDIELDDKIALVEAKHGAIGFTVIIKLLIKIYGDKGYYYEWNDRTKLIFSRRVNIDHVMVDSIVKDCIEFELFDKKIFNKFKILTSKRIQEHYLEATKRRKVVDLLKPYLCINGQNVNISRENVRIISENAMQIETNEMRVKRNEKEMKKKYADTVSMLEKEYLKLIETYGEEDTKKMIIILDNYKGSKGKTYKDDYKAILSWVVDRLTEDKKKNNKKFKNERTYTDDEQRAIDEKFYS
jgi:molybdopterin converting factor small subunit